MKLIHRVLLMSILMLGITGIGNATADLPKNSETVKVFDDLTANVVSVETSFIVSTQINPEVNSDVRFAAIEFQPCSNEVELETLDNSSNILHVDPGANDLNNIFSNLNNYRKSRDGLSCN